MYIFFCSAIPALAFGEQLVIETGESYHYHLTIPAAKRAAPVAALTSPTSLTCRWDSFGGAHPHRHSTGRRLAGCWVACHRFTSVSCIVFMRCGHASTGGRVVAAQTHQASRSQAVVGGQPLLIVGVAEPIVLIYGYMYNFARDKPDLGEPGRLRCCAIGGRKPVDVFAGSQHVTLLPKEPLQQRIIIRPTIRLPWSLLCMLRC